MRSRRVRPIHCVQAQKAEEHKQALAQKSRRAAEEQLQKARLEEEAAAAARVRLAKLQAERGEAAREFLAQRVAAAADEGPVRQRGGWAEWR